MEADRAEFLFFFHPELPDDKNAVTAQVVANILACQYNLNDIKRVPDSAELPDSVSASFMQLTTRMYTVQLPENDVRRNAANFLGREQIIDVSQFRDLVKKQVDFYDNHRANTYGTMYMWKPTVQFYMDNTTLEGCFEIGIKLLRTMEVLPVQEFVIYDNPRRE